MLNETFNSKTVFTSDVGSINPALSVLGLKQPTGPIVSDCVISTSPASWKAKRRPCPYRSAKSGSAVGKALVNSVRIL